MNSLKLKKCISIFLLSLVLGGYFSISTAALGIEEKITTEECTIETIELRATGHFDFTIPANTLTRASTDFPMEYGETVTITATYSPSSASVDFGLIDSESVFHYENTSNGIINQTIRIDERGNYVFAIRNNADCEIHISGFVNF